MRNRPQISYIPIVMPQTTPQDTRSTPVIKDPVVVGILDSVSELMKDRLPYTAGTLALPASTFTLYYKDKNSVARCASSRMQ